MKSRLIQILLLTLALLPTLIVGVMALHLWLSGNLAQLNWGTKIWPVVFLQIIAIVAFLVHAGNNKALAPGDLGGWVLQFIVYIPFGMVSYWRQYVLGNGASSRDLN